MTASIDESWARIENWLAEHAPQPYAALAPPADPADVAELERVIGRPLLRPLVASLLRHDGVLDRAGGSLLPGYYRPISARGTVAAWHLLTAYHDACEAEERGEEVDQDFMKLGSSRILYGHPQLIPVAGTSAARTSCSTTAPGSTGGASTKPSPSKASCGYRTRSGRLCRCSWRRSPPAWRPPSRSTATCRWWMRSGGCTGSPYGCAPTPRPRPGPDASRHPAALDGLAGPVAGRLPRRTAGVSVSLRRATFCGFNTSSIRSRSWTGLSIRQRSSWVPCGPVR